MRDGRPLDNLSRRVPFSGRPNVAPSRMCCRWGLAPCARMAWRRRWQTREPESKVLMERNETASIAAVMREQAVTR